MNCEDGAANHSTEQGGEAAPAHYFAEGCAPLLYSYSVTP
jgi:hypothetical protein